MKKLWAQERPLLIIALLMISFGLAEVVTGFRHEFFGLVTTAEALTTIIGVVLGLCYFTGGILLLLFKKWSMLLALCCLAVDVLGRLTMMFTGMYPLDTFRQAAGIIIGTLIAGGFAVFVFWRLKKWQ